MRLSSKTAIITSAGVILLGTSLALSSAGVVSGASPIGGSRLVQPATTCNVSSGYCLTVSNTRTGSGHHGAIEGTTKGTDATAIYGVGQVAGSIGVDGANHTASGFGVVGVADYIGVGVYGRGGSNAESGIGVEGVAGDEYSTGVAGYFGGEEPGTAVYGDATGRYGVAGEFVSSGNYYYPGFIISDASAGGDVFYAHGQGSGSGGFELDYGGDGGFTGVVTASSFNTDVWSRNGKHLGATVAMTPQATMEDTGTSRLLNGEGTVHFDAAFASTIDARRGYQVFLTPNGDTRGLYVSAKYEGGFIVRENEHGRSSVYFDYRVVAHPFGASEARLPRLSIKTPKLPKLPQLTQAQP